MFMTQTFPLTKDNPCPLGELLLEILFYGAPKTGLSNNVRKVKSTERAKSLPVLKTYLV